MKITIDDSTDQAEVGERLIDVINRTDKKLPQVCYHPQLGPIQTCDTCLVEINGVLGRACGTTVAAGMEIVTQSARVEAAQREAFDRILGNHLLYCTVCDNNNGNCTVHNTTKLLQIEHQQIPFRPKPYQVDNTNPFYRYDPDQCILCGRCVEACQNVQVNETLSIRWEDPHPRVLWDGGKNIGQSSCVSCGHCVTVCPCNALMEKSMLGEAGYMTAVAKDALSGMIDVVKGIEPELGYGSILRVSEVEAAMRESRIRRTKTVCTYCGAVPPDQPLHFQRDFYAPGSTLAPRNRYRRPAALARMVPLRSPASPHRCLYQEKRPVDAGPSEYQVAELQRYQYCVRSIETLDPAIGGWLDPYSSIPADA